MARNKMELIYFHQCAVQRTALYFEYALDIIRSFQEPFNR